MYSKEQKKVAFVGQKFNGCCVFLCMLTTPTVLAVYFNQNGIQLDAIKWVIVFIATLFPCTIGHFFHSKTAFTCHAYVHPRAADAT